MGLTLRNYDQVSGNWRLPATLERQDRLPKLSLTPEATAKDVHGTRFWALQSSNSALPDKADHDIAEIMGVTL